jgi:hypothetical protein
MASCILRQAIFIQFHRNEQGKSVCTLETRTEGLILKIHSANVGDKKELVANSPCKSDIYPTRECYVNFFPATERRTKKGKAQVSLFLRKGAKMKLLR